jgi:membrane-associated phospholipid phosphatase
MSVTDLSCTQKAIRKAAHDRRRHPLTLAVSSLGLVSLIFATVPKLDLVVARMFWDPVLGFQFTSNRFLVAFRDVNRLLPWAMVGTALALLVPSPLLRGLKIPPAPHKLLFVLTFIAAGPGLSVHLIKMLVGRARPRALEEFGGRAFFTPPWEITDQCVRNCSFISGEAASAFALLTLVVFIKPRHIKLYFASVGTMAAAVSLNRVALGAHFLSDVMIAWAVMSVLAVSLWRFFSANAPQIDAIFIRNPGQT